MKNKVIFIIPSLAGGGAERVFINIINNIDKTLFNVTLVYLFDDNSGHRISDRIRTINLKTNRIRNSPLKIINLIRKEKPDLVFSTQSHMNSMIMFLKMFMPRKTKVIIRQTNIMSLNKPENKLARIVQGALAKLYNKADKVICQSEYMMEDFLKNINIERDKVIQIFNPVDIEFVLMKAEESLDYNFDKDYKKIFFLGRLNEVKRIPLIIETFEKYHKQQARSKLFILGQGPEGVAIAKYIEENDLSDHVKLLGFQKNPYKWLKCADLFIMASKHEGMPNALLEALVLEIPVLILKHPGGTIDILRNLEIEDRFVQNLEIKEKSFNIFKEPVLPKLESAFGVKSSVKEYERVFISALNKK